VSTRQKVRAQRTEAYWAGRLAAAPDRASRAAVMFDRARARISKLPDAAQARAWERIENTLDTISREALS
jgi:hypothetical protein